MTWYAAHAILFFKFKEGRQDKYPIWENIYLVRARSAGEAAQKARKRAQQDEGDSQGTLSWENRPASVVLAGIRKVVRCDCQDDPVGGTEVTYSLLEVGSRADLKKLASGRSVVLRYES